VSVQGRAVPEASPAKQNSPQLRIVLSRFF
jgi:hypothetical protein